MNNINKREPITVTNLDIDSFKVAREVEYPGGVNFTLYEYPSEGAPESSKHKFRYQASTLPLNMVMGLSALSYKYPNQKQAILDALSPFQLVSKLWVTEILESVSAASRADSSSQCIIIGSWFGQQLSLIARKAFINTVDTVLVDMDEEAMQLSKDLFAEHDQYAARNGVSHVPEDIFKCAEWEHVYEDFHNRAPDCTFIWNGLEHFEPEAVKWFISVHPQARFVLQSTNMDANDHKFKCETIHDLLAYVPADNLSKVRYAGELMTSFGSRFMVIFDQ